MVANSRVKLPLQTLLPFQVSMRSNQWVALFQEKHLRPQETLSPISKIRKLVLVTQKILRQQRTMWSFLEPVKVRMLRICPHPQHLLDIKGGMFSTKAVKTETLKLIRQMRLSNRHFLTPPRLNKTVLSLTEPAGQGQMQTKVASRFTNSNVTQCHCPSTTLR